MKSYVTMEQKMCPVCGKEHDTNALLLDQRRRECFEMKTTTYGQCDKCKKKGYVTMLAIDPNKSVVDGATIHVNNAHKTGEVIHLRKKVFTKIFNASLPPDDMCYVKPEVVTMLKKMKKKERT